MNGPLPQGHEAANRLAAALARVRDAGGVADDPPDLTALVPATLGVPDGWCARGNTLLLPPGMAPPLIIGQPGSEPPANAFIALASPLSLSRLVVWGEGATIIAGQNVVFDGVLSCGGGGLIHIGHTLRCRARGFIDARNGGVVTVGRGGLWGPDVHCQSDDMHTIVDRTTGRRANAYGGTIVVGDRVWIGFGAVLFGGARLGRDSVVGARSVVGRSMEAGTVVAGVPARVIRRHITWRHADIAPDVVILPEAERISRLSTLRATAWRTAAALARRLRRRSR